MVFVHIQGNLASGLLSRKGLAGKKIEIDRKQHGTYVKDTTQTLSGITTDGVFISKPIPSMTKHIIYHSISSPHHPSRPITNSINLHSSTKRLHISRKQSLKHTQSSNYLNNLSVVERDVHNLISTIQKHKQQENQIILNLRGKFNQVQRRMGRNDKKMQEKLRVKCQMLRKRKVNCMRQDEKYSILKQNKQSNNMMKTTCNTSYCNLEQSQTTNTQHDQHNDISQQWRVLNPHIKSFKNHLRTFITNFSSTNHPTQPQHYNHHQIVINTPQQQHSKYQQSNKNIRKKINYKLSNNTLTEYIYLANKSYNSLELIMKSTLSHDKKEQEKNGKQKEQQYSGNNILMSMKMRVMAYSQQHIMQTLMKINKKLTLSTLRSTYHCLQPQFNPREIIIKILLAFDINPLNEFYLISQETFSMFKRLYTNKSPRKECREFLLRYFCYDQQKITKEQFESSVYSLLKKLNLRGNESTVERLFEQWRGIVRQVAKLSADNNEMNTNNILVQSPQNQAQPQQTATNNPFYSRSQIKSILTNDPLFLWSQILQLIFLV